MKAILKTWLISTATSAVLVAGQAAAAGGGGDHSYASSERFGYTGTVSVYDTWADAKSGHNPRCSSIPWPQRDGAIYVVRNAPEFYIDTNVNVILTNFYSDNDSPSNTGVGIFQLYDLNANNWQNQKAWWSRDKSTFSVTAKGHNAETSSDPLNLANLWNACASAISDPETTHGTFLTYDYKLVATGLNGVEDSQGFITNTTYASNYSGHFQGIFRNESTTSPESNGYYVFDIEFNNISWAADNSSTVPDEFGGERKKN